MRANISREHYDVVVQTGRKKITQRISRGIVSTRARKHGPSRKDFGILREAFALGSKKSP